MNLPTARFADSWAREAGRLPIGFSQVREDPRVDEAAPRELAPGARWGQDDLVVEK